MLSSREYQILRVIVNEYMSSAQPVGSQLLWTRYGLGVSPATIRSVMGTLTDAGFLVQPHTSAGRVPTERAYRLFFDQKDIPAPSSEDKKAIKATMSKSEAAPVKLRSLVRLTADRTQTTGVHADPFDVHYFDLRNIFGQPEFWDELVTHYAAELLDNAPEWLPRVATKPNRITLKVGDEHDTFRVRGIVVVAAKAVDDDYEGYAGLIGSTRMPYRRVASFLDYGLKQLEGKRG